MSVLYVLTLVALVIPLDPRALGFWLFHLLAQVEEYGIELGRRDVLAALFVFATNPLAHIRAAAIKPGMHAAAVLCEVRAGTAGIRCLVLRVDFCLQDAPAIDSGDSLHLIPLAQLGNPRSRVYLEEP
ncbi:hypothetical protein AURDEDRAFT_178673 [Auricularia subglabra TFB-10046 SS5]|uniref:Uncharacterized protein n=1 Tax=Auricularia subglabra (strain TFB-10046 / SS5) TaxID=717982 RepID=J0L7I6_AURST|nr:hypothetical protein AURDEDRAFT_178673 [Auricularia subglabra TFB-10046 SS5]